MIKPENLNTTNTKDSDALDKVRRPYGTSLSNFWRAINFGVPFVEFLVGFLGIIISLYILIVAYTNTQNRLDEMEKSIDSLNMMIDSFKVHANRKYEINGSTRTDLRYDTIIIPHSIIEDLNKLKTPDNPQ